MHKKIKRNKDNSLAWNYIKRYYLAWKNKMTKENDEIFVQSWINAAFEQLCQELYWTYIELRLGVSEASNFSLNLEVWMIIYIWMRSDQGKKN